MLSRVSVILGLLVASAAVAKERFFVPLKVASGDVCVRNTPAQVQVDFAALLRKLGAKGEFDRFSVAVEGRSPESERYQAVDFRLSEDYLAAPAGTVSWLVTEPRMTEFRIWFDTKTQAGRSPPEYVPAIGVGDELMFNQPVPVRLFQKGGAMLADFDGDGTVDVLLNSFYTNAFGWPLDGIFFHRGVPGNRPGVTVGERHRLRFFPMGSVNEQPELLRAYYNWAAPVDWNNDGLVDLLFISIGRRVSPPGMPAIETGQYITFLANTGEKDLSGVPVLREKARYPAKAVTARAYVPAVGAADLDGDGRVDLLGLRTSLDTDGPRTASVMFFKNTGADVQGVPTVADPVELRTTEGIVAGIHATAHALSFGDVNGDGRIDIIGFDQYAEEKPTYWFENIGGSPPVFAPMKKIANAPAGSLRWVAWSKNQGLLDTVTGALYRRIIIPGGWQFVADGELRSHSGALIGGSQEKPEWVDWDGDGDLDLVAGEATGYLRLYRNTGTRTKPRFEAPVPILSAGKPIHIFRDGVFGGEHWHGAMGYPSVSCVDWDLDGLFDLVVPNETNRVFWYQNVGRKGEPRFGSARQILPDGYADSSERREQSRRLSSDRSVRNHPYPYIDDEPFFWRTRIAIADYTGDGLPDMIAKHGSGKVVLYERYRTSAGELRLKRDRPLFYADGNPLDQETGSYKFREVDWDGDGRMDLVVTQGSGKPSVVFLRNVGTKKLPVFARGEPFRFQGEPILHSRHGLQPSFLDWDGDGSLDFVGCNESGHYLLFRHAALTQPAPRVELRSPQQSPE